MKVRKVIRRRLHGGKQGTTVAGGINAVLAATVNEPGPSVVQVSSKERIVQKSHKTRKES